MVKVMVFSSVLSLLKNWYPFYKILIIAIFSPMVFHAISPVICFLFCSSYRQGIKQLLSCCCRHTQVQHAPGGDQIQLSHIQQGYNYIHNVQNILVVSFCRIFVIL